MALLNHIHASATANHRTKFGVKMGFNLKFVGFLRKEKKGLLGALLLYCFILLLWFFFFHLLFSSFPHLFPVSLWQLVLPLCRFEWHDFWQWAASILTANICLLPAQQLALLSSFSVKNSILYPPINQCNLLLAFSHQSCAFSLLTFIPLLPFPVRHHGTWEPSQLPKHQVNF